MNSLRELVEGMHDTHDMDSYINVCLNHCASKMLTINGGLTSYYQQCKSKGFCLLFLDDLERRRLSAKTKQRGS